MKEALAPQQETPLSLNKSKTSTVAIINPATGKIMQQFQNNAEITEYNSVLNLAIAQGRGGAAMKKP